MEQIRKFSEEFFKNLKCQTRWENNDEGKISILVVENAPKSFEDLFGKPSPYRISFDAEVEGCEFIGRGSALLTTMTKFLDGAGKTTLLKIDFDVDIEKEISKSVSFKNCEINNLVKKHKNNFFSRFTFMTTFNYMNEAEQVVNEIYVHDGKIVSGNLAGYRILEGRREDAMSSHIEKDYKIAKEKLKGLLDEKTQEIGNSLGEKAEKEVARVRGHYENLLKELGGELSETIKKIDETEIALQSAEEKDVENLKARVGRLRKELVKIGKDDSRDKILREQKFTINDVMQKHSLNIDNKLANTTVIYYPIFNFDLFLKKGSSMKLVKMTYDPLTKKISDLKCESCGKKITQLNLCSSGHISCDDCLEKCGECGKEFCKKCLTRACSLCGKKLCNSCSVMCIGCGKYVCSDHIRKDCVSGEERCASCLRACLRCHGLAAERYFGEALDGSKICQKCLGAEKRNSVMKRVFED